MSGAPADAQMVNVRLVFPGGAIVTLNNVDGTSSVLDLFSNNLYPLALVNASEYTFSCDSEIPLGSLVDEKNCVEVQLSSVTWTLASMTAHLNRFNMAHLLSNRIEVSDVEAPSEESLLTLRTHCGVTVSEKDGIQENAVPVASLFHVEAAAAAPQQGPVASVTSSGWNPPSLLESARGVLSYLEVDILNGPSVLVAATSQGFRPLAVLQTVQAAKDEGKTLHAHADFSSVNPSAVPVSLRPKVGANASYPSVHALLSEVVRSYLPSLERRLVRVSLAVSQRLVNAAGVAANLTAPQKVFISPPEGTVAASTAAYEEGDATATRSYNKSRAAMRDLSNAQLLAGNGGARSQVHTGDVATRDWREDLAAVLALPRDSAQRAELLNKLRAQWVSAACGTAELAALGAGESLNLDENDGPVLELAGDVLVFASMQSADAVAIGSAAREESSIGAKQIAFSSAAVRSDSLAGEVLRELDLQYDAADFAAAGSVTPLLSTVVDVAGCRRYVQSVIPGALTATQELALFGAEDVGSPVRFCPVLFAKLMAGPARQLGLRPHIVEVNGEPFIQLLASEAKASTGSDGRSYLVDVTRVTPVIPGASDAGQTVRPDLLGRFLVEDDSRLAWAKNLLEPKITAAARALAETDAKTITSPMTGSDETQDQTAQLSHYSVPRQLRSAARRLSRHAVGGAALDFSLRRVELESQSVQATVALLLNINSELVKRQQQATEAFAKEQAKVDASLEAKAAEVEKLIEGVHADQSLSAEQKQEREASLRAQMKQLDEQTRLQWQRSSPEFSEARRLLIRVGDVRGLLSAELHRLKQISQAARGHSDLSEAAEALELAPAPLHVGFAESPLAALVPEGSEVIVNGELKADDNSVVSRLASLHEARQTGDAQRRPKWLQEAFAAVEELKGVKGIYTDFKAVSTWAVAFAAKVDAASQSLPQQRLNLNVRTANYTPSKLDCASKQKEDENILSRLERFIVDVAVPTAVEDLVQSAAQQTSVSPYDVKATLHANGLNLQHLGLVRAALKSQVAAALETRAEALRAEAAAETAANEAADKVSKDAPAETQAAATAAAQAHVVAHGLLIDCSRNLNALSLAILAVETTLLARSVAHVAAQSLAKVPFGQAAGAAARLVTLALAAEDSTTVCREQVPEWLKNTTVAEFRAAVAARLSGHYLGSVSAEDCQAFFGLLKLQRVRIAILSHVLPKLGLKLSSEGVGNLIGQNSAVQAWSLPGVAASSAGELVAAPAVEFHTITSAKHVVGVVPVAKRHLNQASLPFDVRAALLAVSRVLSLPVTHKGFDAAVAVSTELLETCMHQLLSSTDNYHTECIGDVIELFGLCKAQTALSHWFSDAREAADQLGSCIQLLEVLETGLSPRIGNLVALRSQALYSVAQECQNTATALNENLKSVVAHKSSQKNLTAANKAEIDEHIASTERALKEVSVFAENFLRECRGGMMRAIRLDRLWGASGLIAAAQIGSPVDVIAPLWPLRMLQASLGGMSLLRTKQAVMMAARIIRGALAAPLSVCLPVTAMEGFLNLSVEAQALELDDELILELMSDSLRAVHLANLQHTAVGAGIRRMNAAFIQGVAYRKSKPVAPVVAAQPVVNQASTYVAKKGKKK